LTPIAIVVNIAQASFCHPGSVLLGFGFLLNAFNDESTLRSSDPDDLNIRTQLTRNLNRRWGACDQDIYILAVLLNPFQQLNPFSKRCQIFSSHAIIQLLNRLWNRFYTEIPPLALKSNYENFVKSTGIFKFGKQIISTLRCEAELQVI
jgi:hypothetical protein